MSSWHHSDFEDRLYWASMDGERLMAIFQSGFDASGAKDGTFVVAGCLFVKPQARRFRREFHPPFEPYGGFHMTDLANGGEGFRGITEKTKFSLIRHAMDALVHTVEGCVAVGCNIRDAEELGILNDGFQRPYAICCRYAAAACDEWCKANNRTERIKYIFELGDHGRGEADAYFAFAGNQPEVAESIRYAGHGFERKRDWPLFGAADLIAWYTSKYLSERYYRRAFPIRDMMRLDYASLLTRLQYGEKGSRLLIAPLTKELLQKEAGYLKRAQWSADEEERRKAELRKLNIEKWHRENQERDE